MTDHLENHPYNAVIPPMQPERFDELADDIAEHGLHSDIVMRDGKVFDGWHRYNACLRAGVEPRFIDFEGTDEEAIAFVASMNLKRRDLEPGQRAAAVVKLEELVATTAAAAAERMKAGVPQDPSAPGREGTHAGKTSETLAKAANVSSRTIERTQRVKAADPGLFEEIAAGTTTPKAAEHKIAARSRGTERERQRNAEKSARSSAPSSTFPPDPPRASQPTDDRVYRENDRLRKRCGMFRDALEKLYVAVIDDSDTTDSLDAAYAALSTDSPTLKPPPQHQTT